MSGLRRRLLPLLLPCAIVSAAPRHPDAAAGRQLVVVVAPSWESTAATLWRFQRRSSRGPFRALGAAIPVVLGRHGLAWGRGAAAVAAPGPVKREGDGRSPAGRFPLPVAFGRAMTPTRLRFLRLDDHTRCVDDPASSSYGQIVDARRAPADYASFEPMAALYRLGVEVGHNLPRPRPGEGSCIFLHPWSGSTTPTAGCTAMDDAALDDLVHWLDEKERPMLVQLPRAEYARLRSAWGLPALPPDAARAVGSAVLEKPSRRGDDR